MHIEITSFVCLSVTPLDSLLQYRISGITKKDSYSRRTVKHNEKVCRYRHIHGWETVN